MNPGFNLRVYGILWSKDRSEVLVMDEIIQGKHLHKFPGGGVEHLEGPGPALIREFKEELGVEVELGKFLYASPNFHRSFFRPQQLIGLYWEVVLKSGIPTSQVPKAQITWRPLRELTSAEFTHSLDQEVAKYLLAHCGAS